MAFLIFHRSDVTRQKKRPRLPKGILPVMLLLASMDFGKFRTHLETIVCISFVTKWIAAILSMDYMYRIRLRKVYHQKENTDHNGRAMCRDTSRGRMPPAGQGIRIWSSSRPSRRACRPCRPLTLGRPKAQKFSTSAYGPTHLHLQEVRFIRRLPPFFTHSFDVFHCRWIKPPSWILNSCKSSHHCS